jgi:sorbitol-specific phosphotransferase system component IIC
MLNGFFLNPEAFKIGKFSREVKKPLFFLSLCNNYTNVSELTQTVLNITELRNSLMF